MSQDSLSAIFIIQNALLASRLSKRVAGFLTPHGLSFTEYLLMHYLKNAPLEAIPRIELAEQLGMSASGITRLIAPMEKIGIVEKETNARDARQSLVKLTQTGKTLYSEARVSVEHAADYLTEGVTQAQLTKLLEIYSKLK